MKTLSPERTLCLKAADIIEERGLAQFELEDIHGRVCLRGALMTANNVRPIWWLNASVEVFKADELVRQHLKLPRSGEATAEWNNSYKRTKEEVVSALRAAAVHGL